MVEAEGAGVVLYYGDCVYLLERNPHYVNNDKRRHELEYPGGKIEEGENYRQCAIRETVEETAGIIKLNPHQLLETKSIISLSPNHRGICLFAVELDGDQVALISEAVKKIKEKYFNNPEQAETMDIHCVKIDDLKTYIETKSAKNLPNELQLRSFNSILLRQLFEENIL